MFRETLTWILKATTATGMLFDASKPGTGSAKREDIMGNMKFGNLARTEANKNEGIAESFYICLGLCPMWCHEEVQC